MLICFSVSSAAKEPRKPTPALLIRSSTSERLRGERLQNFFRGGGEREAGEFPPYAGGSSRYDRYGHG